MRKLHISLGIVLMLLFAQHGAVLHEIGHAGQAAHQGIRAHADGRMERGCELCLAYSQIANPVGHAVAPLAFEPTSGAPAPLPGNAAIAAATATPRSRGPPAFRDT